MKEDYGSLEDLSEGLGKEKGKSEEGEIKDGDQSPDQHIIDPNQPWEKHSQNPQSHGKGPATGSDDIEAITDEILRKSVN